MRFPRIPRRSIGSLLFTAGFFALYLSVFRSNYIVNDDIAMISLASGYLGGKPIPFLVFSNVLLGFLLNPLYSIHGSLNWEIWLFIAVNFLSVWALVYVALTRPLPTIYRFAGILAVLSGDGYFLTNITFTTIAAFAALAGFCIILMTAYAPAPLPRRAWMYGSLLILIGSLIRIESVLLIFLAILPAVLIALRIFNVKTLTVSLAVTGILVGGGYAFDRIYVSLHPDWNAYYAFNQVRGVIQDTPRADWQNIGGVLPDVGWSKNDYKMFREWFFLDRKVYSYSKLQYLAEHAYGAQRNLASALQQYIDLHHIVNDNGTPVYLLIIAATWMLALFQRRLRRAIPMLAALIASPLLLILYLVWRERVPLHVWYSFLVAIELLGLCALSWHANVSKFYAPAETTERFSRAAAFIFLVMISVSLAVVLNHASIATKSNLAKESRYHEILADLDALEVQGKIPANSLILSPMNGIPVEWSNPLILDWPKVQYFQMEWLTFSPIYDSVLRNHGVQSLPAEIYQKDNIYLITQTDLIPAILEFMKYRERVDVRTKIIYGTSDYLSSFRELALYRLVQR
jgi:hypothetical protein